MPLGVKWSKYANKKLEKVDPVYGIYELGDREKSIIYIGQGILSERLGIHKKSRSRCFKKARYFRFQKTGGKKRAEQRERAEMNAYERRHHELPQCNKRKEFAA